VRRRENTLILLALLIVSPLGQTRALALPDAQALRIAVKGGSFYAGDRVPLTIEIRNVGDAALAPIPVTLTVDDEPYAEWKLPADLAPGQTVSWSLTWNATRGSHLLVAAADPLNDIIEADEANNFAFVNIGAGQREQAFPWSAVALGTASFLIAALAAFLVRRRSFLAPRQ
jgi:subtilase family serine protease